MNPTIQKRRILAQLKQFNSASGAVVPKQFCFENELFARARQMKRLNRAIKECTRCPGMNIVGATESAPGFGSLMADIFFVGQSLCTQCMSTQIPFTEGSGYLIDLALRLSGLTRLDVFMSNVVHCHPQKNRASFEFEIRNCIPFLKKELEIIRPKLVICLGRDAEKAVRRYIDVQNNPKMRKTKIIAVRHPAYFLHKSDPSGVKNWICNLSLEIDKCR